MEATAGQQKLARLVSMESDHDGRVVQIAAQDKVLIVGLVVSQLPILLLSVGAHLDPVLRVVVLRLEMDAPRQCWCAQPGIRQYLRSRGARVNCLEPLPKAIQGPQQAHGRGLSVSLR
jgi:hypothetical protein